MRSYTDLQTYWKCPRLYGFTVLLGYSSPAKPEPMTTGQLVHTALAAHFRGGDKAVAVAEAINECISRLELIQDMHERAMARATVIEASKRAGGLVGRYIAHWADDYKAILVEPELTLGDVVCHPDLLAFYQEQRVIVDFKTSHSPDLRWYDISGQADLYAYVLNEQDRLASVIYRPVDLIIYDAISEEGIYRHIRPPRLEAGRRIYLQVAGLIGLAGGPSTSCSLDYPRPDYTCPNRCGFFIPCWLLETDSEIACFDYLDRNFIKDISEEQVEKDVAEAIAEVREQRHGRES